MNARAIVYKYFSPFKKNGTAGREKGTDCRRQFGISLQTFEGRLSEAGTCDSSYRKWRPPAQCCRCLTEPVLKYVMELIFWPLRRNRSYLFELSTVYSGIRNYIGYPVSVKPGQWCGKRLRKHVVGCADLGVVAKFYNEVHFFKSFRDCN